MSTMSPLLLLLLQLSSAPAVEVRNIAIDSFEGGRLEATYFNPGKPGAAVIFFRNCDQGRDGVAPFARTLAERGVHVVTWDYRSGNASGRDWRGTRRIDAEHVYRWLRAQPGVDRANVVAIGGSCGVSLTLDFAMDHAAAVRGIVILSGPSDSVQAQHVARTPTLGVLGAGSVGEGAAVGYITPVVEASRHPDSKMVVLEGRSHGTDILRERQSFADSALHWITRRLQVRTP